jgi:Domain of unknown function (DUF4203)
MLPHAYEMPAAILILLSGIVACFAGYRLFRLVLAIYGFILGAMLASSLMAPSNTVGMIGAALLGGIVGALIMTFAYFVGIALIGAGMGALAAHVFWSTWRSVDPPALAVILLSVAGAVGAMLLQRYVIIFSTAFSGAWTMIVGGLALSGDITAARAAATGNVWILYPFAPLSAQQWVPYAWAALGIVGAAVQMGITAGKRKR